MIVYDRGNAVSAAHSGAMRRLDPRGLQLPEIGSSSLQQKHFGCEVDLLLDLRLLSMWSEKIENASIVVWRLIE